jgi:hypothetical protein
MSGPPNKRRRTKAIGPDSAVFAKAKTHKTITTLNRSGILVTKDILVPLVPIKQPLENPTASSSNLGNLSEIDSNTDGPMFNDMEEDLHNHCKSKVCILV